MRTNTRLACALVGAAAVVACGGTGPVTSTTGIGQYEKPGGDVGVPVNGPSSDANAGADDGGADAAHPTTKDGGAPDSAPSSDPFAGVSCPAGQTNVAAQWYAVPDCKTYFDTAEACSCASMTDKASCQRQFVQSLSTSLCYPSGATFSADTAATACSTALSRLRAANPSCS